MYAYNDQRYLHLNLTHFFALPFLQFLWFALLFNSRIPNFWSNNGTVIRFSCHFNQTKHANRHKCGCVCMWANANVKHRQKMPVLSKKLLRHQIGIVPSLCQMTCSFTRIFISLTHIHGTRTKIVISRKMKLLLFTEPVRRGNSRNLVTIFHCCTPNMTIYGHKNGIA